MPSDLVMPTQEAREAVKTLLPELPDYITDAISKLSDDNDFSKRNLTSEEKAIICRAYAESGSLAKTCARVRIAITTLYQHLERDPDFRAAFSLSKMAILDDIQSTSVRMAKMEKGTIDRMCQLRRLAPQVYRENLPQVAVGVSIQLNPPPPPS